MRDGDCVVRYVRQSMAIDIGPGLTAIARSKDVTGAEIGNGDEDGLWICRARRDARDRETRQDVAGQIGAPTVAAVETPKKAAVLGPDIDSRRIGYRDFDG
jgi:hypothetical protein